MAIAQPLLMKNNIVKPISLASGMSGSFGAVASISTTYTVAVPKGSTLVVGVHVESNNGIAVQTISDGTNSYTKADSTGIIGTAMEVSLWYCLNATAVAAGTTLTVTFNSATTGVGNSQSILGAVCPAGLSTFDKTTHASTLTSASTTMTSAALSTPYEIVFGNAGAAASATVTYSSASGFTNIVKNNDGASGAAGLDYQLVAATTGVTYTPTFSLSLNRVGGCIATFKGM